MMKTDEEIVHKSLKQSSSNTSGESNSQDFRNFKQPLLGIKFITEVQNPTDQSSLFYCELCNDWLEHHAKYSHIISTKHRFEAIRREDPEWARNLEESSDSQNDFNQRVFNAAIRLDMKLSADKSSKRIDKKSEGNNNSYTNENSEDEFYSYKGKLSPDDIKPIGSMGFMGSTKSYKERSPVSKYSKKAFRSKHWQHDDRSVSPPGTVKRRKRSVSSPRFRSRSRSLSLEDDRSNINKERNRDKWAKFEFRNKSPRPFSRVYSPDRSESPKDISEEIEEMRRRQQRRAEEKRRAEERRKRHAERERREQEEKRRKEKMELKLDKSGPPPKAPVVLDDDTKKLVMQNLTELAKCCVTNEADAELALQVSNALTQAILQYRMRNMPEALVQSFIKNTTSSTETPPPSVSGVAPLTNNTVAPQAPSMQQFMNIMRNQPIGKGLQLQLPQTFSASQQGQSNPDRSSGNISMASPANVNVSINSQQQPSLQNISQLLNQQFVGNPTLQAAMLSAAVNGSRPSQPGQVPQRMPNVALSEAMVHGGNRPAQPAEENAGLLQQIRHLIKQSIVEQQQEDQMQQQQPPPQQRPQQQQVPQQPPQPQQTQPPPQLMQPPPQMQHHNLQPQHMQPHQMPPQHIQHPHIQHPPPPQKPMMHHEPHPQHHRHPPPNGPPPQPF